MLVTNPAVGLWRALLAFALGFTVLTLYFQGPAIPLSTSSSAPSPRPSTGTVKGPRPVLPVPAVSTSNTVVVVGEAQSAPTDPRPAEASDSPSGEQGTLPRLPVSPLVSQQDGVKRPPQAKLQLPKDYSTDYRKTISPSDPSECSSLYGMEYVTDLAKNRESYCESKSSRGPITCGWTQIMPERRDYYCVAESVTLQRDTSKFRLGCKPDPMLLELPRYMEETGVPNILHAFFDLDSPAEAKDTSCKGNGDIAVIVKREYNANLWHTMWEVFAYWVTMDVMSIEHPGAEGHDPLRLSAEELERTQLIFLDDQPLGPFFDLWNLFSKKPIIQLKNYTSLPSTPEVSCYSRVIMPMPAGSWPVWQGDWKPHECYSSKLLDIMRARVMRRYGLEAPAPNVSSNPQITVTIVDRTGRRRMKNQKELVARLRREYPDIRVQSIDFATISFKEQVELVRKTDILVGSHGSALTHILFLPDRSNLVEIQPPDLNYMGFRNLAGLLGHRYFTAEVTEMKGKDWHWAEYLVIDEDRFMRAMDAAIRSMFSRVAGKYIE